MKRYLAPTGWALGMLVLILDSKTALSGAAAGMELCIKTLIPGLFPFFVLSAMLSGSLPGGLILSGILGGYPVGAANVVRAWRTGSLSKSEAERMVVVCNCAGPSFIFGVVGPMLEHIMDPFLLWGVYLLSTGALFPILPMTGRPVRQQRKIRLTEALSGALRAVASVCGWVILLRVLMAVLDRWVLWLLPDPVRTAVYGILELTNGCLALRDIQPGLRFVLAAGMISFGGLCVMLQTQAVADGLTLKYYFPGKLYQCACAMLLASFVKWGAVSPAVQGIFALTALGTGIFLVKSEKRSGNSVPVIV